MSIINILASQNFIVLNKTLIKQLGLHNAVVLSELCQEYTYWHKEKKLKEGWFYSSQNNISENIGLSTRQISNAVQELINQQLISIKLVGMPAITHYFIDEQNLTNLLCKNCITSNAKNDIQEEQILHINNNNNSIKNNNINKERDKQVFDIGIKIFQKQLSVIEAEVIINGIEKHGYENIYEVCKTGVLAGWRSFHSISEYFGNLAGLKEQLSKRVKKDPKEKKLFEYQKNRPKYTEADIERWNAQ